MTQTDDDAAAAGRDVAGLLLVSRARRRGEAETTFSSQIGRKRAAMTWGGRPFCTATSRGSQRFARTDGSRCDGKV